MSTTNAGTPVGPDGRPLLDEIEYTPNAWGCLRLMHEASGTSIFMGALVTLLSDLLDQHEAEPGNLTTCGSCWDAWPCATRDSVYHLIMGWMLERLMTAPGAPAIDRPTAVPAALQAAARRVLGQPPVEGTLFDAR